jgi:glycosyltransferase involved in cell wall biosynthesis
VGLKFGGLVNPEPLNTIKLKISYVANFDATDVHSWSGLGYNIAKALEKQNHLLDYIKPMEGHASFLLRAKSFFYNRLIGKDYKVNRDPSFHKHYQRELLKLLKPDTDIVFSPGTLPIACLETAKPKVIYTDATFAGLIGFYESFLNLCDETIKQGNLLEQLAFSTSQLIIFSSDWAAQTALDNYDISPGKIRVVPFGANIECNRQLDDIKKIVSLRSSQECHLLFLGVDWKRKGGDMALKVAEGLNASGVRTFLHVAGIKDLPVEKMNDFVINYGFISKSSKEGIKKIEELFLKCHFLILPTRADCTPVVYYEAGSFGLAVISTNVGGIPTIIKENVNGKLFSLQDGADEYVKYIQSITQNESEYRELCYSSFNEYEKRLNWNVCGKSITSLLQEL